MSGSCTCTRAVVVRRPNGQGISDVGVSAMLPSTNVGSWYDEHGKSEFIKTHRRTAGETRVTSSS